MQPTQSLMRDRGPKCLRQPGRGQTLEFLQHHVRIHPRRAARRNVRGEHTDDQHQDRHGHPDRDAIRLQVLQIRLEIARAQARD
jgi:hypothetical protein